MTEKSYLIAQKNEITEHIIYDKLSKKCKQSKNGKILEHIANDEMHHYNAIKKITKRDVNPDKFKIWWYLLLTKIFGLAFSLKLMERGEKYATQAYNKHHNPVFKKFLLDEHRHEKEILRLLEDERVEYAGAVVLGLNDALVELSGALAGFTLALRNTELIAVIGFITGFAASLSMATSGFLSSRENDSDLKSPIKSAIYTGLAYVIVVCVLILPYILLRNPWFALGLMLTFTILIIAFYTFYISIAKEVKFWKRFLEMALISLGIAAISFGVGMLLRNFFGIGG